MAGTCPPPRSHSRRGPARFPAAQAGTLAAPIQGRPPGDAGPGRPEGRVWEDGPGAPRRPGGGEGANLPHRISVRPETRLQTPTPKGKYKLGLLGDEEPLAGERPARPSKPGGGPGGGGPAPPRSGPRPPQPGALGRARLGLPSSKEAADPSPPART